MTQTLTKTLLALTGAALTASALLVGAFAPPQTAIAAQPGTAVATSA